MRLLGASTKLGVYLYAPLLAQVPQAYGMIAGAAEQQRAFIIYQQSAYVVRMTLQEEDTSRTQDYSSISFSPQTSKHGTSEGKKPLPICRFPYASLPAGFQDCLSLATLLSTP